MPINTPISREEYLKRKKRKKLIKYGLIAFVIISFITGLSYISHRPSIRISKVQLSGGVLVTSTEVESKSLRFISGPYLWLFPKNNAILYPHDTLEKYLKDEFQRIDTIYVHLKDLRTLLVEITERRPEAVWCDTLINENGGFEDNSSELCYFIDSNSTIFAEAPKFSGDAYFKYYGRVTTDEPIGIEYIASSTLFSDVTMFIDTARQLYLKPLYITGKPDDEFILTISGGGKIYFDTKEPLSKVGSNLKALMRTPALSGKNAPIDYIDLRFGNKLFYKLRAQ